MPSASKSQQRLFGWALACKRGESKDCPANVQKLADTMSEEELEKFASTSHEGLPDKVQESLEEIYSLFADINEGKNDIQQPAGKPLAQAKPQPTGNKVAKTDGKIPASTDNKEDEPDKQQPIPPGMDKVNKEITFTPSLFKLPMGKAKNERRVYDFEKFLKIINYKTHDGITQKGHGQNLTGGE
jgi:hypothetical protein